MLLFSCQKISKSYGTRKLFQDLSLSISEGDRIGLIGPNGAGKSTLLKILAGVETADEGILSPMRGLKIGYVPQECEFSEGSTQDVLIHSIRESLPDYEKERLAQVWLSKLNLDAKVSASHLSGGWKKRLRVAAEMIAKPDLMLFDEPTNHLDLEGIRWLEKFLDRDSPTYLLVSHDRYFLQNVTRRVIEVNPAYPTGLFAIDGPYLEFLKRKEEFLSGQVEAEKSMASKVRRESEWLRMGAKARTTKSKARIDEAEELFKEHREIRARNFQKTAQVRFSSSERETRKLLSVKNLGKEMGGRSLFSHLDFLLSPGSRLGLLGPNGSGKTTLLKMLAGEMEPSQGTIKKAEDLKIVYFDQHRNKLPLHLSLKDALSPNGDYVDFHGQLIHVNGWCKRFLFSPDLLELPLSSLSGGERARISIAHLMLQPADLLLLDEPTNDLDIPTLEALEESLLEFPGALVLITHDRCMLDRLCNDLITLGSVQEKETPLPKEPTVPVAKQKAKLSYLEKKEYEQMEAKIADLERQEVELNQALEKELAPELLTEICKQIACIQLQIEQAYIRWEELDRKS